MAVNPAHSLPNKHELFIGRSGSGKSQAAKSNERIPKAGVCLVAYDPAHDHKARRFDTLAGFRGALVKGLRSKKPFRLAYSPPGANILELPALHEQFCRLIWAALDGRRKLYMIDEELSAVCNSSLRAPPYLAALLLQGRKFGLIYNGIIQFPQSLPKDVYRSVRWLHVGGLPVNGSNYIAEEIGVGQSLIAKLRPLELYEYDSEKGDSARLIAYRYKK